MTKQSTKLPYPISDHFDGSHFFNPNIVVHKSIKEVRKMLREKAQGEKWPTYVKNRAKPNLATQLALDETHITYVNHASHLIQLQQLNVLTDPIFSKRCGPGSVVGPKRVRDPGIELKELPPIHIVLVSHNHYDHMDLRSLVKLNRLFKPLFIVPLGNRKYLAKKKIGYVLELDWWQSFSYRSQQTITLLPAQHWSKRTLYDTNRSLWGSFMVQSGSLKVYFAGDSGYGPHFKHIQQEVGAPTISILPIGAYLPRWFMKEQHMSPEDAVKASLDLQSKMSIATHHQTFKLSYEGYFDPLNDLKDSLQKYDLPAEYFIAPENGETVIHKIV